MMPASNQGLGMNMGFPDVCLTPAAPAPIPIPYPNIGMNAMAMPFCPNIFVSFIPAHNMGAKPLMTNGDNAGVVHPLCMQPGGTVMGNPKILLTGLPAEHLLVPTYGNNFNNPVGAKLVPSITNVLLTSLAETAPQGGKTSWSEAALETARLELLDLPAPSLGITTRARAGGLEVVHVRRDELGARAGLRPGDLLRRIDGQELAGELPRPAAGQELRLELEREGCALEASARWEGTPVALSGSLARERVAVLTIRRFSLGLAGLLEGELTRLVREGARAALLDLRASPGGALGAAIEVLGSFLRAETPLIRFLPRGRRADLICAAGSGRWAGLPLVVLIDRQTASAGEVLAAALQDNRRALVVGQRSFGKGVAESPGGAWAALSRLDGAPLGGRGVSPDLESSGEEALSHALELAWGLGQP